MNYIDMLHDTLAIIRRGYYVIDGRRVDLKLTASEIKDALVFLPEEVSVLKNHHFQTHMYEAEKCRYSCENTDSFTLARKNDQNHQYNYKQFYRNFGEKK